MIASATDPRHDECGARAETDAAPARRHIPVSERLVVSLACGRLLLFDQSDTVLRSVKSVAGVPEQHCDAGIGVLKVPLCAQATKGVAFGEMRVSCAKQERDVVRGTRLPVPTGSTLILALALGARCRAMRVWRAGPALLRAPYCEQGPGDAQMARWIVPTGFPSRAELRSRRLRHDLACWRIGRLWKTFKRLEIRMTGGRWGCRRGGWCVSVAASRG